mmetsp:Transcript_9641/g.28898  ORF Transcript_9641/g.28898 Transcript_9641/m.28898 type:complete len:87 (-) Transcript_9641:234-494(-)
MRLDPSPSPKGVHPSAVSVKKPRSSAARSNKIWHQKMHSAPACTLSGVAEYPQTPPPGNGKPCPRSLWRAQNRTEPPTRRPRAATK